MSLVPIDFNINGILCKKVNAEDHLRKSTFRKGTTSLVTIKWDEEVEGALPISFVQYKIGRCGSTLLSNMLETDPMWKIVSEPGILTSILHGGTERVNKPVAVVLKKALECLSVRQNEDQKYCYIDLFSQCIFKYKIFRTACPDIPEFFLWRHPKEVATSLRRSLPGWYRQYKNINEYIEAIISTVPDDMTVFYYGHVTQFQLPYWLYKQLDIDLSEEKITKMKEAMKKDAKNPNKNFTKDLNDTDMFKAMNKEYSYNPKIINFEAKHPPHAYIYSLATDIEQYDLFTDGETIAERMKIKDRPFVINNFNELSYITPWNLQEHFDTKDLEALKATRENYFVWHERNERNCKQIESKWVNTSLDKWRRDPSLYVVTSVFKDKSHKGFNFIPPFVKAYSSQMAGLRISYKGAITCAHYDGGHTLVTNIWGKKTVLLFPPDITEQLVIYPENSALSRRVVANVTYFNPVQYPIDFSRVIRVTMEPGQMLFFPAFWAHYFVTDENGTITLNWRMDCNDIRPKCGTVEEIQKIVNEMGSKYQKGEVGHNKSHIYCENCKVYHAKPNMNKIRTQPQQQYNRPPQQQQYPNRAKLQQHQYPMDPRYHQQYKRPNKPVMQRPRPRYVRKTRKFLGM